MTPKSIIASAKRALLADVVRPTNTQLLDIKPGNAQVVAGESVAFLVRVDGTQPPRVKLHFSVDGGKFYAVREFTRGANLYDPWRVEMPSVQQSLQYYLTNSYKNPIVGS